MEVKVRQNDRGWVVASRVPGTYPTAQAAARAAWNMRDHGTIHDLTEEPPCPTT